MNNQGRLKCEYNYNINECLPTPISSLYNEFGIDKHSCNDITDENECNSESICTYSNNTCVDICPTYPDEGQCNGNDRCNWNNNFTHYCATCSYHPLVCRIR